MICVVHRAFEKAPKRKSSPPAKDWGAGIALSMALLRKTRVLRLREELWSREVNRLFLEDQGAELCCQ